MVRNMENKVKKTKWTKKFKALFISISLALAVALGGACTAIGITVAGRNGRLGGSLAGGVADETTKTEVTIGEEVEVRTLSDWEQAIAATSTADSYVLVTLKSNLTADATTHKFGLPPESGVSAYSSYGALAVPHDKYIVLDLNGYTINRGLTENEVGGSVINVSGNLVIRDTSAIGNGKITGGKTANWGGGVRMHPNSSIILEGGSITGNEGSNSDAAYGVGGGVYVDDGATFTMLGGSVSGNTTTSNGGGVYLAANSVFEMKGGVISGNTSTMISGGGIFSEGDSSITLSGGEIKNNTAIRGGGLYVTGSFDMSGNAEIHHNNAILRTSDNTGGYAGGLYLAAVSKETLVIDGGKIYNNTADVNAGAISFVGAAVDAVTILQFKSGEITGNTSNSFGGIMLNTYAKIVMTGGKISNNTAKASVAGGINVAGELVMEGGEISNNTSATNGGGIRVQDGGKVTLSGGTISGNTAGVSGGGIYSAATGELNEDGTVKTYGLTISGENTVISNNKATGNSSSGGGGLFLAKGATAKMDGGEIKGNSSFSTGGGVGMGRWSEDNGDGTRFDFISGKINDNSSRNGGGILCVQGGIINMSAGAEICNNDAVYGGGIYINFTGIKDLRNSEFHMTGGKISNNTTAPSASTDTETNGAGIFSRGIITISGGEISDNKASKNGGGISVEAAVSTLEISGTAKIERNTAAVSGGGIYSMATGELNDDGTVKTYGVTINGGTISNNKANGTVADATYGGGGVYLASKATALINNANISQNVSASRGGGIYVYGGETTLADSTKVKTPLVIENITLDGNVSTSHGGGIYTYTVGVHVTIKKGVISNNRTETYTGGAMIGNTNTEVTIGDSSSSEKTVKFIGNKAAGSGGALDLQSLGTVCNAEFTDNTAVENGGAILARAGNLSLKNVTITDNTAQNGGGIFNDGNLSLVGVTVTGNEALNNGGGVYFNNGTLSLGGNAKITIKDNHSTQMTNNVYIMSDKGIGLFDGGRNVEVGVSVEVPLTFITGATTVVPFSNDGTQTGFFPDIPSNYEIVQTAVSGKYNYSLNSKITGTNAARWAAAVNNSLNNNGAQQLFELTENWTAETGGSYGTRFSADADNTSAVSDYSKPFTAYGALCVPSGANVVLDLKNYTLDRALTASKDGGHVIVVVGTLTIKGNGIIKGGYTGQGGGICVHSGGKFILNGGTIESTVSTKEGGTVSVGINKKNAGPASAGDDKATFIMNGGTISNNTARGTGGGGVYVGVVGEFEMNGGTISGNSTKHSDNTYGVGGGVYVGANGTFEMNGGTIKNNDGGDGGGIYSQGVTTINGGTISGNTSNSQGNGGGGAMARGGTFTITGGTISNNTCTSTGQELWLFEGEHTMSGGSISGGSAAASLVYVDHRTTFTMTGGTITANPNIDNNGMQFAVGCSQSTFNLDGGTLKCSARTLTTNGGARAIYATQSTVNIKSGSISGFTLTGFDGAGVYIENASTLNITGGTISGNTAMNGGGVYVMGGAFNMLGGTISGNTASGESADSVYCGGGGVYIAAGVTANITGGEISGNKAVSYGAGIFMVTSDDAAKTTLNIGAKAADGTLSGSVVVLNNTLTATTDSSYGGGICSDSGKNGVANIYGGKISGNTAMNGGGVSFGCTLNFEGGKISDNSASTNGGGVFSTGIVNLSGGEISGNTSGSGSGIFMHTGATLTMNGGTITKNTATVNGGGIYARAATFTMNDGEISYNTSGAAGGGIDGSAVNSTVNLLGGSIHNNVSGAHGGGLSIGATANDMVSVTVSGNMEVYGNESRGGNGGGGLYIEGGVTLTMDGGKIYDNKAVKGGGVCLYTISTKLAKMNMSGGTISGNTARGDGGGVYVSGGTFTMSDTAVISDNAANYGGGVYLTAASQLTMDNGAISNNTANGHGGALYMQDVGGADLFTMNNGVMDGNFAGDKGGGIFSEANSSIIINDGTISGSTANNGGGIYLSSESSVSDERGTLSMKAGSISGNTAYEHGGGVYVATDRQFTMSGGEISGNGATGNGGGIFSHGIVTISGGTISGNEAANGGGVLVYTADATFEMSGGTISGNSAVKESGGGVYVYQNAQFTMSGTAEISNNNAVINGGGLVVDADTTFTMSDGTIAGNTAGQFGGGVCIYSKGTFNMNGGTISDNSADVNGGGVYVDHTFNLKGIVHIENNLTDGKANNVYLPAGKIINVSGQIARTARIGVTSASDVPVTVTSNYGSAMTGDLAENRARMNFKADAEGVVAVYENSEIVLKQGVILTVNNEKGEKLGSISTVNGATVRGEFDEETRIYTLAEDGASANTEGLTFTSDIVPEGYAAFMYAYGDVNKTEITQFTMGTENATVCLGVKALERSYSIRYYLQGADGSYGDTFFTGTNSGLTDSAVAVLDENGKPFATQIPTPEQYSVDNAKGDWQNATVAGDGSTVVEVYLKLNEYTVTFSAAGASNVERARTLRYGEAITEPTRVPIKPLSSFDYWSYDEAGENRVDFNTATVTDNVTLYAQFTTRRFSIKFDLNVGDGDNQIPAADSNKLAAITGGNIHGDKVLWNHESLFDESFGFKAGADAGVYEITYTIDNVSSNKRINGIVPSAVGYTFVGWYEEGATRATTVISTPDDYTEDEIVLTARWSRTQYAIRFDAQNGSRVTSKTVPNITAWESILTEPVRGGYQFLGWYVSNDSSPENENYMDVESFSRTRNEHGKKVFSISDFVVKGLFPAGSTSITLYAQWESMPVLIETVEDEEKGGMSFAMDGSDLPDTNPTVYIGKEVAVTVTANPGFRFKNLTFYLQDGTKETLRDGVTTFTVTSRFVCKGTNELTQEEYSFIRVEAVYSEERYTITYHTDGGRAEDSSFARSYSASELLSTSNNRAKLPSRLTKNGWDFAGWIFESTEEWPNPQYAHATVPSGESYYGAELWLVQPYSLDDAQEATYRNVTLKAMWTPQRATVYLYNATYTENIKYEKDEGANYYYIVEDDAGNPLVTGAKIDIDNPVRDSFDFLGWATARNGAVVYPASDTVTTINYIVNPDHDTSGSALNRNNLYAVWHVKGVNYIMMSATNNGATYGGDSIIMSAQPAQSYTDNDANIRLNYYWYRVFEGMYDQCFTVTDYVDKDGFMWYLDESGNIVSYEKDGVYYDEHKEVIGAPFGTKFTVKDFNPAAVGVYCVERFKRENVAASETPNVTVTDVADSGIYICVVDVVATEGSGSTTRASGYGEIEITMNKAVYGGLSMEDARVEYNTKPRAEEVAVKGLPVSTENGLRTITLPDGSKVNITYTYYKGAGELKENDPRQPITDLSLIKNVGEYHVVASFEFAVGGDKGNYEPLASLEADLYILADVLSVLDYPFMHDGEAFSADEEYTGTYDGKSYGIDVIIKDTLSINAGSQPVTDVDDVAVDVKVYRVTENGDVEIPAANLPTVDAGTYAVVIVGLKGEAASNYVLGANVETRKEYTISKLKYDVADHIHFDDVDDVVFDNEVHLISIKIDEGYSLPETVTVKYKRTKDDYIPADKDFTQGREPNDFDNGGRYAGTYNVTVEFIDTASDNHEAIESMTATLTINKANFFDFYNVDGTDLLRDGGFVSRSYALKLGVKYNPAISGSMLNDTEHFALTYTYYRVNGQTRTDISDGAHTLEDLVAMGDLISHEGKYEIVAHIAYKSALYRNNFEDVKDSDCVINYEISGVPVESVEVTFTDKFLSDGKVVSLGEGFSYEWIKQIRVKYAGDTGTLNIDKPDDILLAGVRFEDKNGAEQNTFWHVGDFKVYVSYYEKESVAYTLTVKQAVENFKLKYSVDGGAYSVVPDDGLELLTDGRQYSFIIEYDCTDGKGATVTESSDAVISAGGLALGKNVLTVTEDFYTFGEVSVEMYEVLTGVKWQYSLDGESWTDFPASKELSYAGKAYSVKAVYGEGANEKSFTAHTQSKKDALNVGDYVMEVGRSGDYRIDEVYSFKITPKKLSFEWNKNSFEYDMLSHTPTIESSGLEEIDEGIVTFGFNYYDSEKNRILSASSIITVGTYYVSVTMGGDLTARGNYTLEGAENAEYYEFAIVRAAINADVYYSESNYGRDITYAGNTELRLNALKADFGENAQVAGKFQFIKPAGDSYEVVDGKSFAAGLENSGELTVHYLYVPDNKNFDELRGTVTLNVLEPRFRTGEGALSVEFGNGAIQFYLVNQVLDTYGIEVYRLYESTYQENGVWYGARERIASPVFRLEGYNGSITNYVITSLDLSGGKIVLIARDGSDSGKLEIPVIDKTAQGMEVANPDEYRKTYYVGETPDFSDIVFRIMFGDDTPSVEVNVGTVKTDYTGGELTGDVTTFSVTFTYFSINIKLDFNVAQKEDLTVVLPKNTVLTFTGDEIAAPELKFTVDGNTIGQNALDGVNVTVSLYFGEDSNRRPVTFIREKGKYTIVYTFEITNPRFKHHDPENVSVEVTAIPYEVDATLPENGQTAYTGEEIELPKPTIGQVTDRTNNFEPVPENRVIRVYTVYDEKRDVTEEVKFGDVWTVVHSGRYVITVTVRVAQEGGAEPLTAWTGSYEYVVTQAKNDLNNASVTGPDLVLKGADGNIDFSAFKAVADFGADAVIWEYSTSRDSGYTTDKPTKVGTYYIRARIAETDDYQGLTTLSKLFEVRDTGIELSGGEGSITGENGIGENWSLEIRHMDSDAVSQTSISKQNVLDGYEVVLRKANGTVVKDEGAYTVRVKLSEELGGRNDLKVFFKDANGNTKELKATVKDGYVEFTTSEFGSFIITSAVAGAPVGLLVAVIVLGVVAAGGIAACVIVFVKKKRKGAQK